MVREAVQKFGIIVVSLPSYVHGTKHMQDIWGRDYRSLEPADAKLFEALDELVDAGEFNRGPYDLHALAYYSKEGTRMYNQGKGATE